MVLATAGLLVLIMIVRGIAKKIRGPEEKEKEAQQEQIEEILEEE